jgi:hypothetical protein
MSVVETQIMQVGYSSLNDTECHCHIRLINDRTFKLILFYVFKKILGVFIYLFTKYWSVQDH